MKPRRHRLARLSRPDFTPFVAVGFILITFFVWLKELQRNRALSFSGYNRAKRCCCVPIRQHTVLFLLANNQLGVLEFRQNRERVLYYETPYSSERLKRVLQSVDTATGHRPVVIIKPTAQSTFKNMVDVLDDVHLIPNVWHSLIPDFTTEEQRLMQRYAQYRLLQPRQPQQVRLTM